MFGVGLHEVRGRELGVLIHALRMDTGSRFAAALAGWAHPLSRGEGYALDILDVLLAQVTKGKGRPVPRPWNKSRRKVRHRSRDEVMRILRPHS